LLLEMPNPARTGATMNTCLRNVAPPTCSVSAVPNWIASVVAPSYRHVRRGAREGFSAPAAFGRRYTLG
jgi:hypothetical protein